MSTESVALALSLAALVFSVLGFVSAAATAVLVLGWKHSTHKIEYRSPLETVETIDAPQHIIDQLPSAPEPVTLEKWVRQQKSNGLDDLYEQSL